MLVANVFPRSCAHRPVLSAIEMESRALHARRSAARLSARAADSLFVLPAYPEDRTRPQCTGGALHGFAAPVLNWPLAESDRLVHRGVGFRVALPDSGAARDFATSTGRVARDVAPS